MTSAGDRGIIRIVLASNNEKKAREMRSLLPVEISVMTASEAGVTLPDETGETFEDNALLKARAAAGQARILAVADDSGLEVDALGGRPGVRSARFAADHRRAETDEENNTLLLEMLADVPDEKRTARFVSAVAVVSPSGDERVCRGTVEGRIGFQARGDGGFGYDPLFVPRCHSRTMAELDPEEKNEISHRGRAFRSAVPIIIEMSQ